MKSLFTTSPFAVVASKETAVLWAGRADIKTQLQRIKRRIESRSDSSLDLMWANLGAGKSHALHHLAYLIEEAATGENPILGGYVEVPEKMSKFSDLYKRIVKSLSLDEVMRIVNTSSGSEIPPNLRRCATAFLHGGPEEKGLATDWFYAEKPYLKDLRRATGIDSRIESDTEATDLLSSLVKSLEAASGRLVLFIDEFQRVSRVAERQRNALLSSLRSVFSNNPSGISIIVAAACTIEKNAMDLMPQELRSIMGMRPAISLPEMNDSEAIEFVRERFDFFRPDDFQGADFSPFGEEVIRRAMQRISENENAALIPRTILQALGLVYDDFYESGVTEFDADEVDAFLAGLRWSP